MVYVLKDGTISEWGTYRQLVARKGAFADFLVQHLQEKAGSEEIPEEDMKVMEELVKEGSAPPHLVKYVGVSTSRSLFKLRGSVYAIHGVVIQFLQVRKFAGKFQ